MKPFEMKRIRPIKPIPVTPTCICYWCGAIYSQTKHLKEHLKYHCNPKNIEAGAYRFNYLIEKAKTEANDYYKKLEGVK